MFFQTQNDALQLVLTQHRQNATSQIASQCLQLLQIADKKKLILKLSQLGRYKQVKDFIIYFLNQSNFSPIQQYVKTQLLEDLSKMQLFQCLDFLKKKFYFKIPLVNDEILESKPCLALFAKALFKNLNISALKWWIEYVQNFPRCIKHPAMQYYNLDASNIIRLHLKYFQNTTYVEFFTQCNTGDLIDYNSLTEQVEDDFYLQRLFDQ